MSQIWNICIYIYDMGVLGSKTQSLDILLIVGKLNSLHSMNKKINALGQILFEISVLCKMFDITQL